MLVKCRYCQGRYDTLDVHVTHRYADCSTWQTPCCDRQADDRQFTGLPCYTPVRDGPDIYGLTYHLVRP